MSSSLTSADSGQIEVSKEVLQAMREWASECLWVDIDQDDIDELSDEQILRGVKRHYGGGVTQFIKDYGEDALSL